MQKLKYKKIKYKYQIKEDFKIDIGGLTQWLNIKFNIIHPYFSLMDNYILVKNKYCYDGPSGPTIDTENFMVPSLAHDVLYQCMREGFIDQTCRKTADIILYNLCRQYGMNIIRAKYVYWAVRLFGGSSAKRNS